MARAQVWRWVAVGALIVVFLWSTNLTLYNVWAAGGPPTPHPEIYLARANTFLVVSCVLLVAIGALVWINVRTSRRLRKARVEPRH